jgi:hypothetical protein
MSAAPLLLSVAIFQSFKLRFLPWVIIKIMALQPVENLG